MLATPLRFAEKMVAHADPRTTQPYEPDSSPCMRRTVSPLRLIEQLAVTGMNRQLSARRMASVRRILTTGVLGVASLAAFALVASEAEAATLIVVAGQLRGASNVAVGESLYDVEFVDGTCIELFNGCDEPSDFAFTSLAAASIASHSLINRVFVDGVDGLFDSVPMSTNGCETYWCIIVTPSEWLSEAAFIGTMSENDINEFGDGTYDRILDSTWDTTTRPAHVYARWTLVPEPGTALLIAVLA